MNQPAETEKAEARAAMIAAIWAELGREPAEVVGQIGLREYFYESTLLGYADRWEWSIAEIAIEEILLISAAWMRAWLASGSDHTAYDLGDAYYYVMYNETDDNYYLDAVLAKADAEAGFEAVQREALATYGCGLGDRFYARDRRAPWFAHAFVDALKGYPDYVSVLTEIAAADQSVEYLAGLRANWDAAVVTEPALSDGVSPPGLLSIAGECEEEAEQFDAWFTEVTVRWRDTGDALTLAEATTLRHLCHYLQSV
jgi:hypothetical protein